MGFGDEVTGEHSIDDVSGDVNAVVTLDGDPFSEALPLVVLLPTLEALLEVVDDLPLG